MPYIGNSHIAGDHTNNFKVLDDISSFTATFDGSASSVIDTTNNTIRVVEHRFVQGQRVTYTNGGGGNIGGLTTDTAYFVIIDSASTIKLATNASNAANSTAINLSAVGTGSSHTLNAAFDGVNTKFKITYNGGTGARFNNATQLNIAINNVLQKPNVNSTTFTEGFAIEDNHKIVFKIAPTNQDIFWGSIIANTLTTFDISDHKIDTFTGDGSTTEFTLSHTPANNESLMVTINGVLQHPSNASTARAYTLIASIIQFTAAPGVGDEIQVRHLGFAGATTADVSGFYGRTGNVVLTSNDHITTGNINAGIVTATSFDGTFSSSVGGSNANFTGIVTAGVFKGGDLDGRNLNISGIATFAGDVSIGGTLTYEDVTNIDSVGLITARSGAKIQTGTATTALVVEGDARVTGILTVGTGSITLNQTANTINVGTALTLGHTQGVQFHTQNLHSAGFEVNQINASGIITATTFKGVVEATSLFSSGHADFNADLDVDGHTNLDNVSIAGITTTTSNIEIKGNNKYLKLGASDQFAFVTAGSQSFITNSTGHLTGRSASYTWENYAGSSEYLRIDSSGRVLIGNTSGGSMNAAADNLVVGSGVGHNGITVFSAADADGWLIFNDAANSDLTGTIQYNHVNNYMEFRTNTTPKLRIASDGTITHTNFNGVGFIMSGSGDPTLQINDTDGTNQYVQLAHNGGDSYIVTRNNTTHGEFLVYSNNGSTTIPRIKIANDGTWTKYLNSSSTPQAAFGGTGQINGITAMPSMAGSPLVVGRDTGSLRSASFGGNLNFATGYGIQGTEFEVKGTTDGLYLNSNVSGDAIIFQTHNGSSIGERLRITSAGDVSIGGRDEALNNYAAGSTTTKLAVVEQSGGSGYSEVAHFTAGTDSNDTGAIVRITQFNNDRGFFIKGGRGTSDQAKAIFGLRNSSAVDSDVMTFIQGGNVGIGSDIPSKTLDVSGNIRCGHFTIDRHGQPTIMMTSTSDTGGGSIYFGSPASGVRGGILYDHNGDKLQFRNIYGTSIEITNDRISTFYGDINIQKGSAYPSANLKIQSHDTANATSRIQFLARDNSNNNETCYIQANSGSTASVDLRFGTDTGEHLRITRLGQLWQYANGGDNQFNSKRTGATSSNGDYYFHLQAINNVDQTVGVLGFHRHSGNDDARFVIHTKQSGVAKEERMRIHADGTVQFSATGSSNQTSAGNRQVFEVGSTGGVKLGNYTDQRRATPADASTITGLRAPNILDWGRDRGDPTLQAGDSISNFSGVWTSWTLNGTTTGNKWKLGQGPHGGIEWLWSGKSAYNDSTSGQGGWNTSFDVDPNYSYMFITYVKRVSSNATGSFYVGTGGVAALGSGATSGLSNPYWTCAGTNNLSKDVWHVCVHYVRSYHSSNTNKLPNAGTYRMSDGSRIADGANCNIGNGAKFNTTQTGHSCVYRSYLFYSSQNDGTELHWAQPHAYKMDGTEPPLMELLGRELANSDDANNWDG